MKTLRLLAILGCLSMSTVSFARGNPDFSAMEVDKTHDSKKVCTSAAGTNLDTASSAEIAQANTATVEAALGQVETR